MNAELLLAHYEQIADAPDAIGRLRRFILDLAVRGKLVPQDAGDEPASELLKRIAKERIERISRGEMRRGKLSADPIDFPFEPPTGWVWLRLAETGNIGAGNSINELTREKLARVQEGRPFIATKDVGYGLDRLDYENGLLVEFSDDRFKTARINSVLICAEGGSAGKKIGLADREVSFGNKLLANETWSVIVPRFVLFVYMSDFFYEQFSSKMKGVIGGISIANFLDLPFPLPPLAEQHRIVAMVEQLMGLCDRLEAARTAREGTRDRLAAASLARLNTPDPKTFQADARFALQALPALTTRPDQIKALRQTILNLAVRGKLVDQDPTDEPISETLNRAMARRAALVKAKMIRAKKLDGYEDLETDANLPSNWVLERLGNLVDPENTISYGVLVPGEEVPDGIPFVRAQDLALSGHPERPNKTIAPEVEKAYARTRLRGGEILVCVVGSIGKLGIVPQSWAGANIARAVARVLPIPEISREYLLVVLRGEPVQACFNEATRTLAQPTLNVGLIEQTPIPLPPLAEQHRIVAKVDELMGLCDRLEASLTAAAAIRRRLLDALLQEALDPLPLDEAA